MENNYSKKSGTTFSLNGFILACIMLLTAYSGKLSAQLTGVKNIPGDYATLAMAIDTLNAQGVGAGGVTLNMIFGNPETAPVGGYAITATGTAANPIIVQGNGNTITANSALVAGSLNDAVFKIIGGDYITITRFVMQENAANTTTAVATNNMTEWGVALLYASVTDGAQNDIVQGNTISLNRTYANSFGVYSNVRHSASNVTTLADITNNTTAPNSSNKVYGNTINNVNFGVVFIGSATVANMDMSNDVGGSSSGTGNTLTNWGGLAAATAYIGLPTTITAGAYLLNQNNFNLSYNYFATASLNTITAIRGILTDYSAVPTGAIVNSVTNNTMTITQAGTGSLQAITTGSTAGAASNVTMNLTDNTVTGCAVSGAASAITIFGVANLGAFGTLNLNNNIINSNTSTATTGGFQGVVNQGAVVNTINIVNNQVGNAGGNPITFSAATTGTILGISNTSATATTTLNITGNSLQGFSCVTSGAFTAIQNSGAAGVAININNNSLGTATGGLIAYSGANTTAVSGISNTGGTNTAALSINTNDVRGITHSVAGSSAHTYINNTSATFSQNISNNTFTNLNVNTTGNVTFISNDVALPLATSTCTVNNNSIVTGFNKSGAGGTVTCYNTTTGPSSVSGSTKLEQNNNFSNVTLTGATTVNIWKDLEGAPGPTKTISNNTFSNWTCGSSA
ncbi:MAG: beta strand repeat-containing protein, partial [Bacteroidia bacterium]